MSGSHVFVKNCRLPIAKAELAIAEYPTPEVKHSAGSSAWRYYQGNQLVSVDYTRHLLLWRAQRFLSLKLIHIVEMGLPSLFLPTSPFDDHGL